MSLERISSFAPLPIRIIAGIAFIMHGLPKFSNIHGTQGLLGSFGLPLKLLCQ
jgi:putative oxidoreductase